MLKLVISALISSVFLPISSSSIAPFERDAAVDEMCLGRIYVEVKLERIGVPDVPCKTLEMSDSSRCKLKGLSARCFNRSVMRIQD